MMRVLLMIAPSRQTPPCISGLQQVFSQNFLREMFQFTNMYIVILILEWDDHICHGSSDLLVLYYNIAVSCVSWWVTFCRSVNFSVARKWTFPDPYNDFHSKPAAVFVGGYFVRYGPFHVHDWAGIFRVLTSVADSGCLSRMQIFIHPGSRIQQQYQTRRGEKYCFPTFFVATNTTQFLFLNK